MGEVQVLLVDADSHNGFPNLALMKLSAWHKNEGHHVDFIKGLPQAPPLFLYDQSYISCIFFQNREKVLEYAMMLPNCKVGGSGWDLDNELPEDVEHILPDYSLYDIDYSMGFTSRGCIRACGFCVVPEKEGPIRDHSDISEFHYPDHTKVILLDNNFQASPNWKNNLDYILEHDLKVNFNQGLDIRLLTKEFAQYLAQVKYYNWTFKLKGLHFAFDDLRTEQAVRTGIQTLLDAGVSRRALMFYILVGYNSTFEEDLKRVEILKELGVKPYIMRYNQSKDRRLYHLARYVNRRYFEFIDIKEYNGGALYDHIASPQDLHANPPDLQRDTSTKEVI